MNQSPLNPTEYRIAFIQSCWHRDIVDQAWHAFVEEGGRLVGVITQTDIAHAVGSGRL